MTRILLVHHRLPWPLNNGMDKLRYNLIRSLSKTYDLTLIAPVCGKVDQKGIEEIKKHVNDLILIPVEDLRDDSILFFIKRIINLLLFRRAYYVSDVYSKTFDIQLANIINKSHFDFIHFLSDFSGCYLLSLSKDQKTILGPMDDHVITYHENYLYAKGIKNKFISYLNYLLVKQFYKKICTHSGIAYFHSSDDLINTSGRIHKKINCDILPVATEIDESINTDSDSPIEPQSIVFVGGLGAPFNQDAVYFFIKSILPLIKEKISNVKFYVVGSNPPKKISDFHDDCNIFVTGTVESVEPFIRKAQVYVSPILSGTGIKTKMVEAIKAGKAIVTTTKGIQGLWEIDKLAIKIEDDPKKFADSVIEILRNEDLRLSMETKAKRLYEKYYTFENVTPITLEVYSKNLK
jgi:polysaccharide biosynthesis protein PslH